MRSSEGRPSLCSLVRLNVQLAVSGLDASPRRYEVMNKAQFYRRAGFKSFTVIGFMGSRALFTEYPVYLTQGSPRSNEGHRKSIYHSASNPALGIPLIKLFQNYSISKFLMGGPNSTPLSPLFITFDCPQSTPLRRTPT